MAPQVALSHFVAVSTMGSGPAADVILWKTCLVPVVRMLSSACLSRAKTELVGATFC